VAQALQVTDDRGVTVTLATPPQRIVSLLPSLTEMVCALDQCQRLVGVDRYSNFPASARALPQVGGGLDPSIEAVVALKPDVVLMAISSRAGERLQALGIKVVALEPKTHADVRRVLEKVGALLGVDDAGASLTPVCRPRPAAAARTRVYLSTRFCRRGEVSFIGETLTRLGVKNIVPASLGPFPKLNPEFVVRANPDLVMVGDYNYVGMEQRPGWSGMRALREKRVCLFNRDDADMLVRPGPRMADGARLMARCIADKVAGNKP
jgi:iron complex transport system substrate-binding protein